MLDVFWAFLGLLSLMSLDISTASSISSTKSSDEPIRQMRACEEPTNVRWSVDRDRPFGIP